MIIYVLYATYLFFCFTSRKYELGHIVTLLRVVGRGTRKLDEKKLHLYLKKNHYPREFWEKIENCRKNCEKHTIWKSKQNQWETYFLPAT